jgi:outer membrane biogenesis lipoprotein LolB
MKRIHLVVLTLALATLGAGAASASTATPRIDRREWRQHQRIQHAWRTGRLTRGERLRLAAGQRHVHRMEWRAKRDGRVDRFERRRITRAQNVESRRIHRLAHNRRSRIL